MIFNPKRSNTTNPSLVHVNKKWLALKIFCLPFHFFFLWNIHHMWYNNISICLLLPLAVRNHDLHPLAKEMNCIKKNRDYPTKHQHHRHTHTHETRAIKGTLDQNNTKTCLCVCVCTLSTRSQHKRPHPLNYFLVKYVREYFFFLPFFFFHHNFYYYYYYCFKHHSYTSSYVWKTHCLDYYLSLTSYFNDDDDLSYWGTVGATI